MCFDINDIEAASAGLINLIKVKWPQSCCDCCDNWLSDSHVEHLITFSHKEKRNVIFKLFCSGCVCVMYCSSRQESAALNMFAVLSWMCSSVQYECISYQIKHPEYSASQTMFGPVYWSQHSQREGYWSSVIVCVCLSGGDWFDLIWKRLPVLSDINSRIYSV